MTNRERKYLSDILGSISLINEFIGDMEFSEYLTDYKTKGAVERYLGIIGEAVVNLRRENPTISLSESDKIIGFRACLNSSRRAASGKFCFSLR